MHVRRIVSRIHRLTRLIMTDHGLRARHDAATHRDLALVHCLAAPIGDHVPIDIDQASALGGQQARHQGRACIDAFELAEKLTQRRIVITTANERLKRMLLGIEGAEAFHAQQRGQKQGLKAAPKGGVTVMQQGKILVRMRALMLADGLFELRHHRGKGLLLIEPAGKQMHPHKGQARGNADDRPLRVDGDVCPKRASFPPAQLPLGPPTVDLAQRYPRPNLMLGGFREQVWAGAMRVLLEYGPKHCLLDFTEFATVTKRWTELRRQGRLTQGDCHDYLLFKKSGSSLDIRPQRSTSFFILNKIKQLESKSKNPVRSQP